MAKKRKFQWTVTCELTTDSEVPTAGILKAMRSQWNIVAGTDSIWQGENKEHIKVRYGRFVSSLEEL